MKAESTLIADIGMIFPTMRGARIDLVIVNSIKEKVLMEISMTLGIERRLVEVKRGRTFFINMGYLERIIGIAIIIMSHHFSVNSSHS